MSVAVTLQALGWVSVVWMVVVHVLVQHERLPRDGMAYRIAGCAAAASVVAASVAEGIWPVAVLGLLWLRIEVFGHRHHDPGRSRETSVLAAPRPGMPALLVGALDRSPRTVVQAARPSVPHPHVPHPHLPHPHLPHPHLPHPHLDKRTVDRVFRVEMGIVIIISLVLFGIWAEQQRTSFTHDTNQVVCNWIEGC